MHSSSLKNSAKSSTTGFQFIKTTTKSKKTLTSPDLPSQRSTKTPQKLNDIQPCNDHDKIFPQTAQSAQRPKEQISQFNRPSSTKVHNPQSSFQRYFQGKERTYEGHSRLKTTNSRSLSRDNRGDLSKDSTSARNVRNIFYQQNYSFKASHSRNTSPNKYGVTKVTQSNYSSLKQTESVKSPTLLQSKYTSERVGLHRSSQSNTSSLSNNLQMSRSHSRTPEKLEKTADKFHYSTNNSSRSQIKQNGNSQRASQNYSSSIIMKKEEKLEEETPKPRMFKAPINYSKQSVNTHSVTPPKIEECETQERNGTSHYQTTPELPNKYQSEKKKTLSPSNQSTLQKRRASPSKLKSMVTQVKRNQIFPGQPTTQATQKIQKTKQQKQKVPKEESQVTYYSLQMTNGKKALDQSYQPLKKGLKYYQSAVLHFNQPANKRTLLLEYKQIYKSEEFYQYIKEIYEEHYTQNFYSLRYCKSIPPRVFNDYKTKIIYLPQIQDPKIKRTVVFDLDETLIHCNDSNEDPCDFQVDIDFPDNETIQACINVRPFCKEVLESLQDHFELVVFTASHQCYAESVLANLDPDKKFFKHRFYRDNCIQAGDGLYIKDLRVIGNRMLKDILIVDNAAYSFSQQIDNGIPIIPFYENKADRELLYLKDYLLDLNRESDWVSTNKQTFNFGLYQESESQDQCLKKLMEIENWK